MEKFQAIVTALSPEFDIITLSEIWLFSEEAVHYNIQGYDRITSCRNDKGGGVAIFIKNSLSLVSKNIGFMTTAESLAIEVMTIPQLLRITVIYRPPDGSIIDFIDELETYVEKNSYNLVLGDMNIHAVPGDDQHLLLPMLSSYGFSNQITTPTRLAAKSPRTLDHIYSDLQVEESGTRDLQVSDHFAVWCSFCLCNEKPRQPLQTRTALRALRSLLCAETWSAVYSANNPDENLSSFFCIIRKAIDKTSSLSSRCRLSSELQDLEQERDRRWRSLTAALRRGKPSYILTVLRDKYNKARNRISNRRAKIKKQELRLEVQKHSNDGVSPWKIIRRARQTDKTPTIPKLVCDNNTITNPTKVCNVLNNFFTTGVSSELPGGPPNTANIKKYLSPVPNCKFDFRKVTESEVFAVLAKIGNPSAGHDGIKAHIIHYVKDILVSPLTHIVNSIITNCVYPTHLKGARVIPIHKGGSTGDPTNYRPISVLPVINKVVEKLLVGQMVSYLENNNLISNNQFGFRKNRGTGHALIQTVEETRFELDKGKVCAALFVDYDVLSIACVRIF